MKKEELILYESPTIAEFISLDWLQEIIAKYLAWKINRKWARYQYRLARHEFFNQKIICSTPIKK